MAAIDPTVVAGLFKEVYGDSVENLVPESARLQKDAKFVSRDKQEGNKYHQPIKTTRSHGWTLATGGQAFPLNPAQPAQSADATVQGTDFVLREVISYNVASRLLAGKGEARKRAFVAGSAYMVENMTETSAFVLETQLLHGQRDIGIVNARISGTGTTSQVFSITAATFIPALWAGMENGFIEAFDTTAATQRNPSADMQVTAVDVENLRITVSGNAAELDTVVATDKFYLRGTKSAGMVGACKIASNTGSLFGVDAATYSLWNGNTFSAGSAALSFVKVLQGLNKPINRGLNKDVVGYISPKSWTDCMNDLAALRRYSDKAGEMEQGTDSIKFHGQSGSVELVPHILMKPSEALFFPKGAFIRLGSSELSFNTPGMAEKDFFQQLPDHAGYSLRCFWSQALFCATPAKLLLINNIVNSDD
jgi:hypothetical protein